MRRRMHPCRRPLPAGPQRDQAVRPVAHDSGKAVDVARACGRPCFIRRRPIAVYRCDGYQDFILFVSRLTPLKRADLLIRALATADGQGIKPSWPEMGRSGPALEALAKELRVDDRSGSPAASATRGCWTSWPDAVRCAFPRFRRTTASSPWRRLPPGRPSSPAVILAGRQSWCRTASRGSSATRRRMRSPDRCARLPKTQKAAERMGEAGFQAGAHLTWPTVARELVLE